MTFEEWLLLRRSPRCSGRIALLVSLCVLLATGCGGTSTGGGGGPAPIPSFTLSVAPSTLSVQAGQMGAVAVTAIAVNGFNSSVTAALSGLPAGVTATPGTLTLTPGVAAQLTLTAATSTQSGSYQAALSGTAGGLTARAQLGLTITQAAKPVVSASRTRYLRTDGGSNVAAGSSNAAIYDASRNRFYVADDQLGRVLILDPGSESVVGQVAVPGALSIDETADHSTLYVASLLGDVYTIDALSMKVTHRYLAAEIGPSGFGASSVYTLPDGRLVLLGGQGPLANVDGASAFAVWNPSTNAFTLYATSYGAVGGGSSPTIVCGSLLDIGGFTLNGDRTRILLSSIDSDATLCSLDPVTGNFTTTTAGGIQTVLAVSPDGKSVAMPSYPSGNILIYDTRTLQLVRSFAEQAGATSASSLLFSADSNTVYIVDAGDLFAYDVATGASLGWLPSLYIPQLVSSFGTDSTHPSLRAIDASGLLLGPIEEGIALLDTKALRTGAVGTVFANGFVTPATGPAAGGTAVQLDVVAPSGIESILFGPNAATAVSSGSTQSFATAPAGPPGPVDVVTTANDSGVQYLPQAYNYGPTILEVTPDLSTAEGTGQGVLFGYGFGSTTLTTGVPTDLSLKVGGQAATITGFIGNAYNADSPPMPLEAITYTVPAHAVGSADVAVSTGSGSSTVEGGMTYLAATKAFPLTGASLAQGIYDPVRDLYYFTDTGLIEVFSLTQGKWLTPIAVPSAPQGSQHRLWGIALSPNGTQLAVTDAGTGQIFLLDPTGTATPRSFQFSSGRSDVTALPAGVAVSDSGLIYFGVFYATGDTGYPGYYRLDTITGAFTAIAQGPGLVTGDAQLRLALSADNARLYLNVDGEIENIDTATLTTVFSNAGQGCCYGNYELTLSSNQVGLAASNYLLDTDMHGESTYSYNVREASVELVYGAKLSPDGSLLFQPDVAGIDVIDGHRGNLLHRLALPFALSQNFDALVSNGLDNRLLAITGATGTGIALLDLTSIVEPTPPTYTPAVTRPGGIKASTAPPARGKRLNLPALRAPHRTTGAALPQ